MLPDSLRIKIKRQLAGEILSAKSVSGGSINRAARVEISGLGPCFLKWNRTADPDMFQKEVHGLKLLTSADSGLRIPEIILQDTTDDRTGFLLLEYVSQGKPGENSARNFGERLAKLHSLRNEQFGLEEPNYIGRLPQQNNWHENWTDFFIQERIQPQLDMALQAGKLHRNISDAFDKLFAKLPDIFPEDQPSLLHGDLWGGNYFYDENGEAVIFDPAVYYGHREIELAFTHLFGGFSSAFYDAYRKVLPMEPGFETRKNIYNLYPLLVHTNLFGGSYARQVEGIVRRFL